MVSTKGIIYSVLRRTITDFLIRHLQWKWNRTGKNTMKMSSYLLMQCNTWMDDWKVLTRKGIKEDEHIGNQESWMEGIFRGGWTGQLLSSELGVYLGIEVFDLVFFQRFLYF